MSKVEQTDLIIEGKAKAIYNTTDPALIWVHNLDQATALNGKKKEAIANKAHYTNAISGLLFQYLTEQGIENHFIEQLNDSDVLVKKLKMAPVEVVTRNFASGSFERKYAVEHLKPLTPKVQEFYFKNDELDDPTLNDSQILALDLASAADIQTFRATALQVNEKLVALFAKINIMLVDFKIELGYLPDGRLILADELSPDNMRLVDQTTKESLDKDVFRKGTGEITAVYEIVLSRLQDALK
ncbi:MAG: phosphoribosylaminoimidazolesuccinocarboxamide synthase [Lactobacillaceae bacterium]|jgi:phosphoribosylaminoimidazole-succinocarboxamide synthase|nr:phosphoribosylaminoimidazolesuccinocarboxamide synthase [Lactobacillaceae bacterium]